MKMGPDCVKRWLHGGEHSLKKVLTTWEPGLLLMGVIVSTLLLYWRIFSLPVYHDDIVVLGSMANISLSDVLLTTAGHPSYYRPVGLAPLKIIQLLADGTYSILALHTYYLVLYGLSGWLSGMLARRLWPDRLGISWLAMGIFIVFPFNYQTVPWVSAGIHIQTLMGTLAITFLLDRWWESRQWLDLILAWLMVPFAAFSHENGVITGVLISGWLLIRTFRTPLKTYLREWWRLVLAIGPILVANILYFVQWTNIPRLDGRGLTFHADGAGWNLLYFGQGFTYPTAQFGGFLTRGGLNGQTAALILVFGGLALLSILLWLSRDRRAWLGAWWYGIGILPSAILLSSAYIVDGPRLMTLASAGASLAWAAGIDTLWRKTRGVGRAIPAALIACLIVGGGWFVSSRMALHDLIAPLYQQIFAEVDPDVTPVMVVNIPEWLAPEQHIYALGNEGIGYLADYYPFRDMVMVNTGRHLDYFVLASADITPAMSGIIAGMAGESDQVSTERRIQIMQTSGRVYRVKTVSDRWALEYGEPATSVIPETSVIFKNGICLFPLAQVVPEIDAVEISMTWNVLQPENLVAFVHLLCEDEMIAQADGTPLGGLYPFEQWLPGQSWHETRLIGTPSDIFESCLRVRLGLYHPDTGERVPLEDNAEFVIIPVEGIEP